MKSNLTVQEFLTTHKKTVHFVKPVHAWIIFWSSNSKTNTPQPPFYSVIICVGLYLGNLILVLLLWRRLWRSTVRGNLKMVLTELMCRTAVWKVPILRWRVFWRLGGVSLRFPVVLWEFQKPEEGQRRGNNSKCVCCCRRKTGGGWQSGKRSETWRGVFVHAPFWWCWACSSAAKHGTFSHRSYCLGSVKKDCTPSHLLCSHVPRFCCFVSPPVCLFSTQSWVLTLWFPQRRASPLGSTTLNTRLPWSSHLMYSWYRSSHSSWYT